MIFLEMFFTGLIFGLLIGIAVSFGTFLKNSTYRKKSRHGFEKEIRQILKADEKLLSKDISDHSSQTFH